MKHIKLLGIFVLLFFSCSEKKEGQQIIGEQNILMPMVEGDEDTVANGSVFITKAYLTIDSLYKVALSNGITNYLNIRYEEFSDTSEYFFRAVKIPKIVGDTAFIEFEINIPNLKTSEIREYNWQVDFNINFKSDKNSVDTSFIYQSTIFVKND